MSTFSLHNHAILLPISTGWSTSKKLFNLSWMRVQMFYCGFNFLDKLLNGDLAAKIGQGILSKYLIDIEFNCSLPYKVNINCVYEGKCQNKCLIYEVKCLICDAIYIGNTHQTLKKKNGRSFLRSPMPSKKQKQIIFICCPFRTAL